MDILHIPGQTVPGWAEPVLTKRKLVLEGLSNADYHGTKALVSKSSLDVFQRSAEHYKYMIDTPDAPEVKTEAMIIGSAFHSLVLEPHNFSREFVQLPEFGDMRSSKNRDLRDSWIRHEAGGRQPLKAEWLDMIRGMRESIFRLPRARVLLEQGRPEVTAAAVCPQTGLMRKVRWDWLSEVQRTGVDLKSAENASHDYWWREAVRRRYEVQDTYYTDTGQLAGLDVDFMAFLVVEKEPPYAAAIYLVPDAARVSGEQQYLNNLHGIATCIHSNHWPGYNGGVPAELNYPKWALAAGDTVP